MIRAILKREAGPRRDIVLLNAAAGIIVGGRASTFRDGMLMAAESVDSGAAQEIMNQLIQ